MEGSNLPTSILDLPEQPHHNLHPLPRCLLLLRPAATRDFEEPHRSSRTTHLTLPVVADTQSIAGHQATTAMKFNFEVLGVWVLDVVFADRADKASTAPSHLPIFPSLCPEPEVILP